jgi:integrase
MSSKIVPLRQPKKYRNATSRAKGRLGNEAYRVREHLTEAEMDKLLAALKRNRHGHRDWLIGLVIYRHGLRVSEACDLRWDGIDLPKRAMIVRRLKGSTDSVHYLERDEVNGLKMLQRQQQADGIKGAYVFINERGQPFARMGIGRMIERAGEAAGLPFPVHVQHAPPLDRIRTGGQGNGHTTAPALPRTCLDYKHRAIHSDVAGAVQGYLALIKTGRCLTLYRASVAWIFTTRTGRTTTTFRYTSMPYQHFQRRCPDWIWPRSNLVIRRQEKRFSSCRRIR